MTALGWLVLGVSWGVLTYFTTWCLCQTLRGSSGTRERHEDGSNDM